MTEPLPVEAIEQFGLAQEDVLLSKFHGALDAKLAPKSYYGFDPTIIITVIVAVLQALAAACKPTPAQIKRKGLALRLRTRVALSREMPQLPHNRRQELTDDVVDVAAAQEDKDIHAFVAAYSGGH